MAGKTYRVLVVDDNQDSATSMTVLLTAAGFDAEACFDGPSALASAEKVRPDACLLDINMPGMDGYELARRIRDRYPDRPPVFATMTAYGDIGHLERAVDAGFDLQFTKPVDPAAVAEQLDESVHRAEPEDDPSAVRRLLTRFFGRWSKSKDK